MKNNGKKRRSRRQQWILAIADKGIITYAEVYPSKKHAEQGLIDYLRREERYDGPDDISEAAVWLSEHDERLGAEIIEVQSVRRPGEPYGIDPPPQESGPEPLWRVIYTIDVNALTAAAAAVVVHRIMQDPESLAPVLEVMDACGDVTRVDLSETHIDRRKEDSHG